jgi:hypothetical protein
LAASGRTQTSILEHLIEKRDSHRILAGKSEEKVAHGRARHRWEDNIKVKLFLSHIIFE